jgi:hypothetical protein
MEGGNFTKGILWLFKKVRSVVGGEGCLGEKKAVLSFCKRNNSCLAFFLCNQEKLKVPCFFL